MKNDSKYLSIIDKELKVEGTISSKGRLIIKGSVNGTLVGESVVIAEEGFVSADIEVINLTIGGKFEGTVKASEKLVILSTGSCSGKVVCKKLVVMSGGGLNAEVASSTSRQPDLVNKIGTQEKV